MNREILIGLSSGALCTVIGAIWLNGSSPSEPSLPVQSDSGRVARVASDSPMNPALMSSSDALASVPGAAANVGRSASVQKASEAREEVWKARSQQSPATNPALAKPVAISASHGGNGTDIYQIIEGAMADGFRLPAALIQEPSGDTSGQQQAALARIEEEFLMAIQADTGVNGDVYQDEQWEAAQAKADERYRALMGQDAYNFKGVESATNTLWSEP